MADDERSSDEREPETGSTTTPETGDDHQSETDDTADGDLSAQVDRMRRALNKANREAAANRKRLSEYEDRDKTEQQKASERATDAEKRAQQAEMKLLRLEVAARKGLPAALAARLQGSTEDELEEDADALSKLVGDKRDGQPSRRRDPDQGRGNGRADSEDQDMNDWLRRAVGVRAE